MSDPFTHEVMAIDPESASPDAVPTDVLRAGLEHEENLVRTRAAKVAATVADDDHESVTDLVPQLIDNLDDERTNVIVHSALALTALADEKPTVAEDAVGPIVDLLDQDPPIVQLAAAQFVRRSITGEPRAFLPHLERLVQRTTRRPDGVVPDERFERSGDQDRREFLRDVDEDETHRQWATRVITANMIAELASVEPTAVAPSLPELVSLLDVDSDDVGVLTTVADVVATVAEHDAELVEGAVDSLVEILDHYDRSTVATAVSALGFVGDPSAADPLRALADDHERDEDLRELAGDTATFLERRTTD